MMCRYSLTGSKEVALLLQELVDLIPLLPPTDSPLQESSSALTSPARNPNAIMIPASGNQERSANGHRSPLHRQMGTNKAKRQLFPTFSL